MYDADQDFASSRVKVLIESGANTLVKGLDAVMLPRNQQWSNLGVNWSFREHNKVRLGSTMWNYMTDADGILDPRLAIFFEPNVDDEWIAFPQISDENTVQSGGEPYNNGRRDASYADKGVDNIYSSVNYYLIRDELDIPEILMTSAEVKYLRAEIFLRGIGVVADAALAGQEYTLGMLESLEYWQNLAVNSTIWQNKPEILGTAALFGVSQHPKYALQFGASQEESLRKIYAQRWIDSFRQPWEAYSLLRRTHMLPREKVDNTLLRFQYPPSESALNTENYLEQTSSMGGDETTAPIWWDVD